MESTLIKSLCRALALLSLLLAIPVVLLLAYDATYVRPRLPEVEQILAQCDPEDAYVPEQVRMLVDAQLRQRRPMVGAMVLRRIDSDAARRPALGRVLFESLLPLHLDRTQLQGLHAALAWNGRDHGLNRLALRAFGLPLDQLSPVQAATVVAMSAAPGYYARSPRRLEAQARMLLLRAGMASLGAGPATVAEGRGKANAR